MSGYSATPLAKKLGIAAGARLFLHDAPANYCGLVAPLPAGVRTLPRIDAHTDVIHVFATRRAALGKLLMIRRTRRPAPGRLARTRERS